MKTLTFVNADANAATNADPAADAKDNTIALHECCSGELKIAKNSSDQKSKMATMAPILKIYF